ncbi:uncharacterized protein A4U43_C06F610 [Asparagus officinalis]|uniref:Uncharacterized protein n=1 Tax=Asparagus officinalis TaxID=4686 RepID=A0A5P1EIH4_ASPOF|nr:uncharacterized protein A4U43_C06F610 [Asparagus officinalis]
MLRPAIAGENEDGDELLLVETVGSRDPSWRLNFDGFRPAEERKEKPPRRRAGGEVTTTVVGAQWGASRCCNQRGGLPWRLEDVWVVGGGGRRRGKRGERARALGRVRELLVGSDVWAGWVGAATRC